LIKFQFDIKLNLWGILKLP